MMWNIHGQTTTAPISISSSGDNTIIAAITDGEIFIHELIGDAASAVTLTIKAGSRTLRTFTLSTSQGLTENDFPGIQGEPIFKCYQNEAFILNLSSAVNFSGGITYSYKR